MVIIDCVQQCAVPSLGYPNAIPIDVNIFENDIATIMRYDVFSVNCGILDMTRITDREDKADTIPHTNITIC